MSTVYLLVQPSVRLQEAPFGSENETCKIPDESREALINPELRDMEKIGYPMPSFRRECQMCTLGTVSSARSSEA